MGSFMKNVFFAPLVAVSLAGCGSLLDSPNPNKLGGPSQVTVPAGNNLVLPPDLQLAAPGNGTAPGYDTAAEPPPPKKSAALAKPVTGNDTLYGGGSAAPQGDVFDQYGISKTKPDGTPKTQQELANELKAAILRKKRQKNPGYGTIANIGNIFSDDQ